MTLAIQTENLSKHYRKIVAVKSLNLAVPAGSVFGFLGPNGAGKTTTIMMLLGNIHPDSGQAWLLEKPARDIAVRHRVGFLPEKFQFHDFLTATEFLHLHGGLSGMSRDAIRKRIPEVLDLVGLADRANSRIREFSKGMQQRIGLAQAIIHDPDVVILDEPTSALDPIGRRDMRDIIKTLKARGKTVFLNSHILSEIEHTCDDVAILKKGEVVAQGQIDDLLSYSLRVDIQAQGITDALRQRLESVCHQMNIEGDHLVAHVRHESDIPELAKIIIQGSARLMAMIPHRESLEDLFVRVVETGEHGLDRRP